MRRLLVLGRGTTATRVARAARSSGWEPVGVLVTADRDATWTRVLADAVEVPSYEDVPALVAAARRLGATAVHPGTGFAAESAEAARAVLSAGLAWAGPSPEALEVLGDKTRLAGVVAGLGLPAPRTSGVLSGPEELAGIVASWGVPAVLKTALGGGGRGVVDVPSPQDAQAAWLTASGLGPLLVQEAVVGARHIEVQALADGAGGVALLGTRECSVQRRAQKVLEEAPAPGVTGSVLTAMEDASRRLLAETRCSGPATCEFLLREGEGPLLLEVNARLQVEHGVTEEVSGVDLVVSQLALAEGAGLDEAIGRGRRARAALGPLGAPAAHAVEARLYAEDPVSLVPDATAVARLEVPRSLAAQRRAVAAGDGQGAGLPRLRTEIGTFPGDRARPEFSEPLALLVAAAGSREEALDALTGALNGTDVVGPRTLRPVLRSVLDEPALRGARVTTRWFEEEAQPRWARGRVPGPDGAAAPATSGLPGAPAQVPGGIPEPPTPAPGEQPPAATVPVPAASTTLRAPMAGTVVATAPLGSELAPGGQVVVLEAMKMRLRVPSPVAGALVELAVAPGDRVREGQVLAVVEPAAVPAAPGAADAPNGPTTPMPPAAPGLSPSSTAGSPGPGPQRRSAAERAAGLADPGSLREVVDADAVLTARARLAGREVALWVQDVTSRGGTIGLSGARRVADLISAAAAEGRPVVSVLDGGGARVQEGADALGGVGLILAAEEAARGRCLQVGLVVGAAAGGAAYAPALADVLVMVEGAGRVFLTGPAVLTASTGERVDAEALGGAELHATRAGTAHLTVPTEEAAWAAARRLMAWAPISPGGRRRHLALHPGGAGTRPVPGDRSTDIVVPIDLAEPYDVRGLLARLTDRGDLLELRPAWAGSVVTALTHIEGVPVGVIATQPDQLAGSLTPEAAQKAAEHLALCRGLGLPVLTVVDTPGFLPGPEPEAQGVVRHGAALVAAYASFRSDGGRLVTLVTRRAYGGAFVALGSKALSGARALAWPGARIGVMDAGSAAELTHRRELAAMAARVAEGAATPEECARHREAIVEGLAAREGAAEVLEQGWIDEVVAPGSTRARLAALLTEPDGEGRPAAALAPVAGVRHPGDGWVECSCGSRHWGLNGAAGLLVWRRREERIEVLLQHRAVWTHRGGTWGLPGGAVADGEGSAEAALREAEEEAGLPAGLLVLGSPHVQQHADWSYTTFAAQAPTDPAWDVLVPADGESSELRWTALKALRGSWAAPSPKDGGLLPAFERVWPELAALLPRAER